MTEKPGRFRRFLARTIVFAVIHFIVAIAFVVAWTRSTVPDDLRTWEAFGYSAGAAAFSFPLYQSAAVRQHLQFLPAMAINSAICGVVLAILFSRVRRLWLLLLFPLLWFGTLTGIATLLERRVDANASRVPITNRFPHQTANDSSRRVDRLLMAIGGEDFSRIRSSLLQHLTEEFARGDDRIEPLPADVQRFIVAHRFDIDSLEIELLMNEPPRWEIDLTATERADWPRYFSLQKILLADALDSAGARDLAGARQRLEAAQHMTFSLSARPEASAVMVAIAATENQLGVARKLGIALPRFDARGPLIDAFEADAWTNRFLIETSRFDRDWEKRNAVSRALLTIFVRPFARVCAAERLAGDLRNAQIVRNLGRCVFQTPKYPEEPQSRILNPIDAVSRATAASRAVRANRLLLDFEGTEIIASGAPAIPPVSSCPDRKWVIESPVVHLVPPLPASNAALPTHHTINPEARKSSTEISPATGQRPPSAR